MNNVGHGGLGVTCSPRDSRFADSMDIFRKYKFRAQVLQEELKAMDPESEISGSLKNLKPEKNRPLRKIESAYSRPSNTLVPI